MKRLFTFAACVAVSLFVPACHDDEDHAHVTTTTTTESTRVVPSASATTTVERY